jgi:hypothetical protein
MSEIDGIREPGVSFFGITEPVGEPCESCGDRPGLPQKCICDGSHHRHGMSHIREGNSVVLWWLCDQCWTVENAKELERYPNRDARGRAI